MEMDKISNLKYLLLIVTWSTYNKGHMMSGSVSNGLDELKVQAICKSAKITDTWMHGQKDDTNTTCPWNKFQAWT